MSGRREPVLADQPDEMGLDQDCRAAQRPAVLYVQNDVLPTSRPDRLHQAPAGSELLCESGGHTSKRSGDDDRVEWGLSRQTVGAVADDDLGGLDFAPPET